MLSLRRREGAIQLAELFSPDQDTRIRLASQIGISHAIVGAREALSKAPRYRYAETLAQIKAGFQAAGLTVAGVESHPVPAEKIKLGLPGCDEEIENYRAAVDESARHPLRISRSAVRRDAAYRLVF